MKIAFFYDKEPWASLTEFWTGSRCYHVAFVDEYTGKFWDMNLRRRRGRFQDHYANARVAFASCPVAVSVEYLESKLETDNSTYGFKDYFFFALRPFYKLLGLTPRNGQGVICSEMVYNDLVANGWLYEFDSVPSPADIESVLLVGKP